MAKIKLPIRVREALDKGGWQEYGSTSIAAQYRRPLSEIVIQPSSTHKGRFAIVLDYKHQNPTRSGISAGVDTDTLIRYLTTPD